jgi:hypothetical protein
MSNINHKEKNIFIHVPKTAGTSMEIQKFVGGNSHATARVMKEIAGDEVWKSYFKWAFVREPLDRFISSFFHYPPSHYFKQNVKGFREFVHMMHSMGINTEGSLNGGGHHHHHFVPQHYFLCDTEGKIMVDFVGRFSQIKRDWDYVSLKISGEKTKLAHERKSDHGHFSSYYGDVETIKMVKEIYKKDYEIFEKF